MIMTNFLSVSQVMKLHEVMIERHGGETGVRDMNLLESAVMSPQASFGGEYLYKDVPEKATAYLFGIAKNHAFIDGNKRSALVSTDQFVSINGCCCDATNRDMRDLTYGVAEGSISQDRACAFLKKTVVPKLEIDKPKVVVDDTACGKPGFIIDDKIIMPKSR